jgi:hypothetical protein
LLLECHRHRRLSPLARRAALAFLPLLAYSALAVLLFHHTWSDPRLLTVGTHGDPEATVWYWAWMQHAVTHGTNPALSDFLNYPAGINLTWQTAQPLEALVTWPVSAIFDQYVAFNLMATAGLALSAWCAYLALRRWVPRRSAAFAGGLLYGFSPYMAAQSLGHLNLTMAFVPPLLLLLLDEILVRQRRSWLRMGLLLGALATVQLYITEELLATEAVMALVAVVVLAITHRQRWRLHVGYAARALGVALALAAPLCAPWVAVQFFGPHRLPGTFQHPGGYSSDLLNFVLPTYVQQVYPGVAARYAHNFTGNTAEQNAYLGIPLLLILAYTVWRFRSVMWVRVVAVLGAVAALLSMGPTLHVGGHLTHIPLPWVIFEHLPVFGNIVPSRVMLYAFLMAALLLALFVDHLVRVRGRALAVGGVAVAAAVVLLLPTVDFPAAPHDDPAFFHSGGDAQRIPVGADVLIAPFVGHPALAGVQAWQVVSGLRFRQPAGYFLQPDPQNGGEHLTGPILRPLSSALVDIAQGNGAPLLTDELRARMHDDLRYWRVHTVVVGPWAHEDEMVMLLTDVLGAPPVQDQGVFVWWDVQPGQPVAAAAASLPASSP